MYAHSHNLQPAVEVSPGTPVCSAEELLIFKKDLKELLRGALGMEGGRIGHMIKWDYSSIVPDGHNDSGAHLWNRVTLMGGNNYYIPQAEGKIVLRNTTYFNNLFAEPPSVIDLGPGGSHSLDLKSFPTFRYVKGKSYTAIDLNEAFAINAARAAQQDKLGITAQYMHHDFTKPFDLKVDAPILMMMYGCTLSQFPMHDREGETTLKDLLLNLGAATNFNALLIATIDTNINESSALDCYAGQHFYQFKRHLWSTAKALLESSPNRNENYIQVDSNRTDNLENAVVYAPRFDEGNGIVHSFVTRMQMTIVIDGEKFIIPQGTTIDTGYSQKLALTSYKQALRGTGWKFCNELGDGHGTVRALVLAGKNVSLEQIARAESKSLVAATTIVRPGLSAKKRAAIPVAGLRSLTAPRPTNMTAAPT